MKIVRQIEGGYFQDSTGAWWLLNPQTGWVRAEGSRAFSFYLELAGGK